MYLVLLHRAPSKVQLNVRGKTGWSLISTQCYNKLPMQPRWLVHQVVDHLIFKIENTLTGKIVCRRSSYIGQVRLLAAT